MKRQQGFTLIELMIVVAIIGILAAIAIPQYQNYVSRAQLSGAYSEVASLKTGVENYLLTNSTDSISNESVSEFGWAGKSNVLAAAPTVAKGTGDSGVTITGTMGSNTSSQVSGDTITLTRTTDGNWSCKIPGAKESIAPSACDTTGS